jgi:hypothetical protein
MTPFPPCKNYILLKQPVLNCKKNVGITYPRYNCFYKESPQGDMKNTVLGLTRFSIDYGRITYDI